MIPVTKPYTPNEKKYFELIQKVNQREWFTNFGPLHNELTARLEDYLGVKNLLLVSNGTFALQIAYKALNLSNKVFTTPFTFVASTSSLLWEGLKPDFVDIEKRSLALDKKKLPQTPSQEHTGVLAVHVYGNPADTISLDNYGEKNNLKVIYDGAHAFGVSKNGKSILSAGDASTLSFHATKVFHTIEGGAIVFKKRDDYEKAKSLINFGFDDLKDIRNVGVNCKLNEYQAAAGLVLMDEIETIIEKRVLIWQRYRELLKNYVEIPEWDFEATPNGAYAPILLENESKLLKLNADLQNSGIQGRRYFHPSLNQVSCFGDSKVCPISENISSRILCLPIYTTMTKSEQDSVISAVIKAL